MHDRSRWTTLNLAGLAVAVAAAESQRTGLVALPPVGCGSLLGRLVRETAGTVVAEPEVLEAAVVHARVAGSSWQQVGDVLGQPADVVRARYAGAERAFRLAEAFPCRRDAQGRLTPLHPGVLRFPDASARWLGTALLRRGLPSVSLDVDDATWVAQETAAVALMRETIEADALPDGVDPTEARFDLEHRRLELLLATQDEQPAPPLRAAIERGVRTCDALSRNVAAGAARDAAGVAA